MTIRSSTEQRHAKLIMRVSEEEDWDCSDSALLTVAFAHGRVIGFQRYIVSKPGTMESLGTWVHHKFRRQGVATRIWSFTLKRTKAKIVWAAGITIGGQALIRSMARKYPHVEFPTC